VIRSAAVAGPSRGDGGRGQRRSGASHNTAATSVLPEERKYLLQVRIIDLVGTVIMYGIKYGSFLLAIYMITDAAKAFAGKTSVADLALRVLADIKAPQWVAYALGLGGVGWGWNERRLRHRTVARMARNKEEAEKRLDPGRTSSNLTAEGKSRPEDEI